MDPLCRVRIICKVAPSVARMGPSFPPCTRPRVRPSGAESATRVPRLSAQRRIPCTRKAGDMVSRNSTVAVRRFPKFWAVPSRAPWAWAMARTVWVVRATMTRNEPSSVRARIQESSSGGVMTGCQKKHEASRKSDSPRRVPPGLSAYREDALGATRRSREQLQVDVIAGALEVFEDHLVITCAEPDLTRFVLGRMLTIVVDHDLAVDDELGAVIAGDLEVPHPRRGDAERPGVPDGEPLEQLRDLGETLAPRTRRDVPFARVDQAEDIHSRVVRWEFRGVRGELIDEALEATADRLVVAEHVLGRRLGRSDRLRIGLGRGLRSHHHGDDGRRRSRRRRRGRCRGRRRRRLVLGGLLLLGLVLGGILLLGLVLGRLVLGGLLLFGRRRRLGGLLLFGRRRWLGRRWRRRGDGSRLRLRLLLDDLLALELGLLGLCGAAAVRAFLRLEDQVDVAAGLAAGTATDAGLAAGRGG